MAKVSLTKLGLKVNQDVKNIEFNEQIIEVKQYLPVNDKLELITNVINSAHDENNFANPVKVSVFTTLEIMYAYTNINFTDKQKEEFCKTFDLLESNGVIKTILDAIPSTEVDTLVNWTLESVKSIYTYNNSVMGVLENLKNNYNELDFDITSLQDKIKDPESLELLKQLAPLLDLA